jgi:hypothetical protein
MYTDADGNIIFSSSKGSIYYFFLVLMIMLGVFMFFLTIRYNTEIWTSGLFAVGGAIFFLAAVLFRRFCVKIRYTFETDGIRLNDCLTTRYSMVPMFTPYIKIREFYEAHHVLIGYGASTDCVVIRFMNKYGNKDTLALSPDDKQLFISELTKRTGIPVSPNPRDRMKRRHA